MRWCNWGETLSASAQRNAAPTHVATNERPRFVERANVLIAQRPCSRIAEWARNFCKSWLPGRFRQSRVLLAGLSLRYNASLKSDGMIVLGNLRGCCFVTDKLRVRAVLYISFPIAGNRTKVKVSEMSPTLEHDSPIEWLAFGSHNDAIVLAPRARIVFAPVQLQTFKSQRIKADEQVLRPLVAITAFPQAVINEEVIEDRRPKHAVFSPELAYSGERAVCQQLCFFTKVTRGRRPVSRPSQHHSFALGMKRAAVVGRRGLAWPTPQKLRAQHQSKSAIEFAIS
jgi:hypothetical protein